MILLDSIGHLTSDESLEELHAFASRLGLKRRWFQNHPDHPHYDLTTDGIKRRALHLGAIQVSPYRLVLRMRETGLWNKPPPRDPKDRDLVADRLLEIWTAQRGGG